jgi:hypothetical protein
MMTHRPRSLQAALGDRGFGRRSPGPPLCYELLRTQFPRRGVKRSRSPVVADTGGWCRSEGRCPGHLPQERVPGHEGAAEHERRQRRGADQGTERSHALRPVRRLVRRFRQRSTFFRPLRTFGGAVSARLLPGRQPRRLPARHQHPDHPHHLLAGGALAEYPEAHRRGPPA